MDHSKILGTVLAGGKSQRFGEDKSQVKLGGQLLIDYVLAEIIDVFNEISYRFENSDISAELKLLGVNNGSTIKLGKFEFIYE